MKTVRGMGRVGHGRGAERVGKSARVHAGGARLAGAAAALALGQVGCGTNETLVHDPFYGRDAGSSSAVPAPTQDCSIAFVTPRPSGAAPSYGGGEMTCAGDQFATEVQLQTSGQSVELVVNGLSVGTQYVADPQAVSFATVLGNRGQDNNTLLARAFMPDGRSCEALYPLDVLVDCPGPSCLLTSPEDSAGKFGADSDLDPERDGVQTTFVVNTDAAEVSLTVDGLISSSTPQASEGAVRFEGVTLPQGEGRIVQAVCTDEDGVRVTSAVGQFDVGDAGCRLSFVAPELPVGQPLVVGGGANGCGPQVAHSFRLSGTAQTVELTVNGLTLPPAPMSGLFASFPDVLLSNRGAANNVLQAVGTAADGSQCQAEFPVEVLVDCEAPSCTLLDPASGRAYVSEAEDATSSLDDGFQVALDVTTDASKVQLVIDGMPSAAVSQEHAGGVSFAAVALAEGVARRIHAVCTDEAGNETRSAQLQWTVDTTPCSIVVGAVQPSSPVITPNDDTEPSTPGIQLSLEGTVAGEQCQAVRAVACGETLPSFEPAALSGQTWSLPVTVPEQSGQWDVCVEVRDVAGNIARGQSSLEVRVEPPALALESPVDGTQVTLSNDLSAGNTTCEARVVVHCAEIGAAVSLLANGQVLSSPAGSGQPLVSDCVADSSVPSPYLGRALFESASIPSVDGATVDLEARQTVAGLTGSSTQSGLVQLTTDCVAPTPAFSSSLNCGGKASLGVPLDVAVFNGSALRVELLVDPADGPEESLGFGDPGGLADRFEDVDVGGRGTAVLTAVLLDPSGNEGRKTCTLSVVDEPTVSLIDPVGGSVLTTATADCSVEDGLQVQVVATTNAPDGSAAEVGFVGAAAIATTVSGGEVTACVDAPEGSVQTLTVTVTDPGRPDVGTASGNFTVDTEPPTTPIGQPLVSIFARRAGQVQFDWTAVADVGGGALAAYELRCRDGAIVNEGQWDLARSLEMDSSPAQPGEAESEVVGGFRVGVRDSCLLRGVDAAGALTPIDPLANVLVALDFEQTVFEVDDYPNGIELSIAPLGDINGDGIADFASGTTGGDTLLFFGRTAGQSTGVADVRITSSEPSFGGKLGVLGDINNDGLSDFSISAFTSSTGGAGVVNGSVYIFYGREATEPWPSVVSADSPSGCGADACLHSSVDNALFGFNVIGADYDGDGHSDVIVGAPGDDEGKVYILRGGSQFAELEPQGIFAVPGDNPDGFVLRPPGGNSSFGDAVATVGPLLQGSVVPTDLVISSSDANGVLWYLPAGQYVGTGLRLGPTAVAIVAGVRVTPLKAIGDISGDQLPDVAVGDEDGGAVVYVRNINGTFSDSPGGSVSTLAFADDIAVGDNYGSSVAVGFYPHLGLVGDLDADGIGEMLLGARFTASTDATLLYGGQGARPRTVADYVFSTDNTRAIVNFVGDVDGDSFNDFAVLDSGTGTNRLVLHH